MGLQVRALGRAIYGESTAADGVKGVSDGGNGVYGSSRISTGVKGESSGGFDESEDDRGKGVLGKCDNGIGVNGFSKKGYGVVGFGHSEGYGVVGVSYTQTGVYGQSDDGFGVYGAAYGNGYAWYLDGRVYIRGPLYKPGGWFMIDHPLDPANKYLCHSFVESPDMKNIYDGMVTLDNKGEAEIDLPDWFGALNKNYRYQLTAIGAPGPKLCIAKEISESSTDNFVTANKNNANNHSSFKIAGGTSGMKVSWQVTGIRKDPWANAHRVQVEEDKPDRERGYYIYPELHDQPADRGISSLNFPEGKKVPFVTKRK